jgi:hypothetical protein
MVIKCPLRQVLALHFFGLRESKRRFPWSSPRKSKVTRKLTAPDVDNEGNGKAKLKKCAVFVVVASIGREERANLLPP